MGTSSRMLFLFAKTNMSSVRADELSALQASAQPLPAPGSDAYTASDLTNPHLGHGGRRRAELTGVEEPGCETAKSVTQFEPNTPSWSV